MDQVPAHVDCGALGPACSGAASQEMLGSHLDYGGNPYLYLNILRDMFSATKSEKKEL